MTTTEKKTAADLIMQGSGYTLTIDDWTNFLVDGDISGLPKQGKLSYLAAKAKRAGLDPRDQPFGFIKDNRGKEVLYARKGCADQIGRRNKLGTQLVKWYVPKECVSDMPCAVFHVRGQDGERRTGEDIGVVPLFRNVFRELGPPDLNNEGGPTPDARKTAEASDIELVLGDVWEYDPSQNRRAKFKRWGWWETKRLVGDDYCNALMKGYTKARRRLTLGMYGIGVPDEAELDTMGPVEKVDVDITGDDANAPWGDGADDRIAAEWIARINDAADLAELEDVSAELVKAEATAVEEVTAAFEARMLVLGKAGK